MNDPMPPYWKPPRRDRFSTLIPVLVLIGVTLLTAGVALSGQPPAAVPQPACQQPGTGQ